MDEISDKVEDPNTSTLEIIRNSIDLSEDTIISTMVFKGEAFDINTINAALPLSSSTFSDHLSAEPSLQSELEETRSAD